jgi:hypothetical protein
MSLVRGTSILIIFFLMFTVASLLAPFPMFPGNYLTVQIGPMISEYAEYLSSVVNGVFYGTIVWLVFAGISRKLVHET